MNRIYRRLRMEGAMRDEQDWKAEWQGVVDAVGKDFSEGALITGADAVDPSVLRRYLEPLEFDCPLHHDAEVARTHGYSDVIAPATSIWTLTTPALWEPGAPSAYPTDDRDALPARGPAYRFGTGMEPAGCALFATSFEADYVRPIVLGDRLSRVGRRLVSCDLKATTVGRGAFTTWESQVVNQRGELVASFRQGLYFYRPTEMGAKK
jgi:N-terminal half of MaoC dehydratase